MSQAVATDHESSTFVGNDKLLYGMICGVLSLTLFAQTMLNIAPAVAQETGVKTTVMNIAVSITTLFSGMFIVVVGGLADRLGRVKVLRFGFVLSLLGSIIVGGTPSGAWAQPFMFTGATVSNFFINATSGMIVVAMSLVQVGAGMTAQEAGFLTLGYAVVLVAFYATPSTALGLNFLLAIASLVTIAKTIPKHSTEKDAG